MYKDNNFVNNELIIVKCYTLLNHVLNYYLIS